MTEINLEGLSNAEKIEWYRTASPEDIYKHDLLFMLKQFVGFAEKLCNEKSLFFRLYNRKLARCELSAASIYVKRAESEGYASTTEIKEWIDKYQRLSKRVRLQL